MRMNTFRCLLVFVLGCRVTAAAAYLLQMSVRTVIGILCLIVMISITVVTWRKARQKQKRHTAETVYDL